MQPIPYEIRLVDCGNILDLRIASLIVSLRNAPEQVRRADGTNETSEILDKAQLVKLLDSVFGLTLPTELDGIDRYLPMPTAATL